MIWLVFSEEFKTIRVKKKNWARLGQLIDWNEERKSIDDVIEWMFEQLDTKEMIK